MKKILILGVLILLIAAGCNKSKQNQNSNSSGQSSNSISLGPEPSGLQTDRSGSVSQNQNSSSSSTSKTTRKTAKPVAKKILKPKPVPAPKITTENVVVTQGLNTSDNVGMFLISANRVDLTGADLVFVANGQSQEYIIAPNSSVSAFGHQIVLTSVNGSQGTLSITK